MGVVDAAGEEGGGGAASLERGTEGGREGEGERLE